MTPLSPTGPLASVCVFSVSPGVEVRFIIGSTRRKTEPNWDYLQKCGMT